MLKDKEVNPVNKIIPAINSCISGPSIKAFISNTSIERVSVTQVKIVGIEIYIHSLGPHGWPWICYLYILSLMWPESCLGISWILTWFPGQGACGPPKLSTVKHGDSNKKSHNPSLPFSFNPKQQSSKWTQIVLKASGKWLNHGLLMNLFFYVLKCLKCLITS